MANEFPKSEATRIGSGTAHPFGFRDSDFPSDFVIHHAPFVIRHLPGDLTLSYTPNNQVPKQRLYEKLKSMLNHLGMHPDHLISRNIYMKTDIPIAGCAHQAGTCRFGTDAKTSVLDKNCKAHELDNLYVVDTSFFVSIGAVNPSLTAIANAIRVGDHLLQRLS